MNEIFTKKWFIATVIGWVTIILLDELVYYWWKSINPGAAWSGLTAKPLQETDQYGVPNG